MTCPDCNGNLVAGVEQFEDSWICPTCNATKTPKEVSDKRDKAHGCEVNPTLMMVEIRRELEGRIFKLEERVKALEAGHAHIAPLAMMNMKIGGRD